MSEKIGVGIVGLSDSGWATVAHVPALAALPEYELVALATTRQESADAAAARHGVPIAFDDARKLVAHPDVDVVTVAVKAPAHGEVVWQALAAGKHVFCEWPLGTTTAEAAEMAQMADDSGRLHIIGLQAREHPAVREARRLVEDGYIGRLVSATLQTAIDVVIAAPAVPEALRYSLDERGGLSVMTVPAMHALDAYLYVAGELRQLDAIVSTATRDVTVIETGEAVVREVPDQLVVHGVLDSGGLASIHVEGGAVAGEFTELRFYGTGGTLVLAADSSLQQAELTLLGARAGETMSELDVADDGLGHLSGLSANVARVYRTFGRALSDGGMPAQNFGHALERHRLLDSFAEASASGRRQDRATFLATTPADPVGWPSMERLAELYESRRRDCPPDEMWLPLAGVPPWVELP